MNDFHLKQGQGLKASAARLCQTSSQCSESPPTPRVFTFHRQKTGVAGSPLFGLNQGGFRVGPMGPYPPPPFVVYSIFQHYMFNMESRHLLNLSVQKARDCISENFNLKNFPGGACTRNSLEKCAFHSPDGHYRPQIATVIGSCRCIP